MNHDDAWDEIGGGAVINSISAKQFSSIGFILFYLQKRMF